MKKHVLLLILFCYIYPSLLLASITQTHIYLLGDVDNFNYNGHGSVDDVYIEANIRLPEAMKVMTQEVEQASKELQCEAALLFLPPDLAQHQDVWQGVGYDARTVKDLSVRAWQDAAMDSMKPGTVMLFKQLRKDRVLRPV